MTEPAYKTCRRYNDPGDTHALTFSQPVESVNRGMLN